MPVVCCVRGCIHSTSDCKLKRFPSKKSVCAKWEIVLKENYSFYKRKLSHRMCHCHFAKDQFITVGKNYKKLKINAVPTIFSQFKPPPLLQADSANMTKCETKLQPGLSYSPTVKAARRIECRPPPSQPSGSAITPAPPMTPRVVNAMQLPYAPTRPVGFLIPVQSFGGKMLLSASQTPLLQGQMPNQISVPVNIISGPRPVDNPVQVLQPLVQPQALKPQLDPVKEEDFLPVTVKEEQLEEFDEDDNELQTPPVRELCRLCAQASKNDGDDMTSIFSEWGKSQQIADKIMQHLPISVTEEDRLPLRVCRACVAALEASHELVLRCTMADNILLGMLLREDEMEGSPIECPGDLCEILLSEVSVCDIDAASVADNFCTSPTEAYPSIEFQCKVKNCTKVVYLKTDLRRHYVQKHKMLPCKKCELAFDTEEQLATHQKESHSNWNLCDECGARVKGKGGLRLHMQIHIPQTERQYICPICNAGFSRRYYLKRHSSRHAGSKTHECPTCKKKFFDEIDVKLHMRIHAEKDAYKCDLCSSTYSCKRYLAVHKKRAHFKEWFFKCLLCNEKYNNVQSIYEHIQKNHSKENNSENNLKLYCRMSNYCCNLCGRYFANHYCLRDHTWNKTCTSGSNQNIKKGGKIRSNKDNKRSAVRNNELMECDVCKDVMRGIAAFTRHQRKHGGLQPPAKPFMCELCSKSFSQKVVLVHHIRTHTGEKPFTCQYCTASFAVNAVCKAHERQHTGEKPFKCQRCPKEFSSCSQRRVHFLTHVRPFQCTFCSKRFSTKLKCETHKHIHTGHRPYHCKVCARGFIQKQDMERHQLLHTNEKKYKCSNCNFESNKLKIIQEHIETTHLPSVSVHIIKHNFS